MSSWSKEYNPPELEDRPMKPEKTYVGTTPTPGRTSLDKQVGGDHYRSLKIQPVEYIHANNIGFIEGAVIKYVTRWRNKNGLADLEKAKHFIELLIDLETKGNKTTNKI